ncbi:hypothetical protein HMPREF0063_10778 [Aeromicrobium marinum DSM 15272]|uniref:DUF445 domain-containing protein n=2 Tax=Aeromicrobium marinum TaxID=219314 RepID=E2S9Y8_9ACTN|nr:hypothetical protein HMPREF0063_10778 [Aeromicrobium marinum DSM 15272]
MADSAETSSFAMPAELSGADLERRRGLRRMRIVATSLLGLAAVVFLLTRDGEGAWGYVNAGAEAAMVGAIADWFAVTALFKHPLGLPIPHTAIIPKRKESLGDSLQEFVVDNFLQSDVVSERIMSARVASRAGAWLADAGHAERVVRSGSRIAAHGLRRISSDDVAALVQEALVPKLEAEELSPVVGQLLGEVVEEGAHTGLVDLVTGELHRWLVSHEIEVAALVEQRAPWWTPQWVDERVSQRLHLEAVTWVKEIHDGLHHPARRTLDRWLATLAHDLQHDPDTRERAERLKNRLLTQPQLIRSSISIWDSLRGALIEALHDDDGLLRRRAIEEVQAFGRRLESDPRISGRLDEIAAEVASYTVEHYGHELATVISATVKRWDGVETSRRIELHVGRDLQFIRINGTVVGGLAGLVIHTLTHL